MSKKSIVIIPLLFMLTVLMSSCKISTTDLFYKGQEVEYINWCNYEAEPEKAVKENLLIKEYGDNELMIYKSEGNTLRFVYITTDKYLQWEENGVFDLEKDLSSEEPLRILTKSGKYIEIVLVDHGKDFPEGYDINQISFDLDDTNYNIAICTKYVD